jgi:hypothetical protein
VALKPGADRDAVCGHSAVVALQAVVAKTSEITTNASLVRDPVSHDVDISTNTRQ